MKTKQRGSGKTIAFVFWLYELFGYRFVYYFMYPVAFAYALIATNVRESLAIFYNHLGIEMGFLRYFNHCRVFAVTMVDRFISKADPKSYVYEYDDSKRPLEIFSSSAILLFSHYGGWAASSNSSRTSNTINIVMKEELKSDIKAIEERLGYKESIKVIDINTGPIAVSIAIANALQNNEVVAVMADRASNPNATIEAEFLGENALFNKNPFEIAYKTKTPLVAYFVILKGIQKYKVEFVEIAVDYTKSKEEAIREALEVYVRKYEEVVRKNPQQWFNFYNFWEK